MALISKTTIQEVNTQIDAVSVIGNYVRLEKRSGRWWGKCPFHAGGQEKTPSFKVDPDLKSYHCFGCNKSGTVIGFVMEMENISYPEAIKELAKKTGIKIVYEEGAESFEDATFKEQLYELYSRTAVTFNHFLTEKPEGQKAKEYLLERGINDEIIGIFKLGYAPNERNFLFNFLKQKGYSEDFLGKSGLFSRNYKTVSLFSGRIIFPITDRQGRIVAFGGRIMPEFSRNDTSSPKYINSPETEIYKKGQNLYAFNMAIPEIRKSKTIYITEGYMDVIALHKAGITNAIAPLGTAFTDEQAVWLSRWAEKAVLIFDNDTPGQKAAIKAILACRKNGIVSEVCDFTKAFKEEDAGNFKDPAEILQKFGPEMLKNACKFIIFDFEYLLSITKDKNRIGEYLYPFLDNLKSEVERDDYIARIADFYLIDKKAVQNDYLKQKRGSYSGKQNEINDVRRNELRRNVLRRNIELVTLIVTAVNRELYIKFRSDIQIKEIEDKAAKELFIALEECYTQGETGMDSLLARINDQELRNFIVSRGATNEFKGENARRLLEDGIKEIRKKRILKRLTEIGAEIRQLERNSEINNNDDSNIDSLLAEKKELDDQLRILKRN